MDATIFDVDGTLVDSERDGHRVAFNAAFEEEGLPYCWDVELYGRLLEITGGQHRLHAFLEEEGMDAAERDRLVPRLHARKTELFRGLVAGGGIQARPGVMRLLDDLVESGVRVSVSTTGSRGWVEPLLARLFGHVPFEPVITGDEAPIRKPDPSAYVMALGGLGMEASRVVAVEDSANGLAAAHGAGLACAVVVNDYTAEQDFSGAELVATSFGEVDVASLRRIHERAQRS